MTGPHAGTDLGAYVLGALPPDDRRRVDAHLGGCAACRAELAEFQALTPLLSRLDEADLSGPQALPPPDLYERVRAAVDEQTRPARLRRRRLLIAAAALLLVVASAVVWVVLATRPADGPATHTAVAGPVRISVVATGEPGGTDLDVTVAGLASYTECRLLVVDRDGGWHPAGEWAATYDGEGWFRGWTDVEREALAAVVLRDGSGEELIRVPV
ncbi:anti-sigma factor family protein [Blastococcus sp. SYSU D00813]